MTPTILIIDDQPEYGADLEALLHPEFACHHASTGEEGLGVIAVDPPDAVVLDLMITGGRNGLEILAEVRKLQPHLPVIMVTQSPSRETETAAIDGGALYYLHKSAGRREVLAKLRRCCEVGDTARERDALRGEQQRLRAERDLLRQEASAALGTFLGGRSPVMRAFDEALTRAAKWDGTVLITGEIGTGKSLVARELHRRSARSDRPVLQVNMGTLAPSTVRDDLFGHVPGAFTDARSPRKGYFEAVGDGTLILDEIGDLPRDLQAMLLQVIEERRFLPVGSSEPRIARGRLITATSCDLAAMVKSGAFRADLLTRLKAVSLRVPALREHPEDIPELANYFLGRHAREMRLGRVAFSPAALGALSAYSWRGGNVRDLDHTILNALTHHGAEGVLGLEAFHLPEDEPQVGFDYNEEKERTVRRFQRGFFERAFRQVGGLASHARPEDIRSVADLCRLPPHTVRRILRELGTRLDPDPDGDGDLES